jgi:signal transduction histidine kinase
MSSESLYSGNRLLMHSYKRANELAQELLCHQVSIFFLIDGETFNSVWWAGYDAEAFSVSSNSYFLNEFQQGFSRVLPITTLNSADPEIKIILKRLSAEAALIAPFFINGKLKGLWLLAWNEPRSFTKHDELIMEIISTNLGLNLQSIMIGSENLRLRREAKAVHEINKEISRLADINLLLENIAEKACCLLKASNCYIALADEEKKILHVRVNFTTRTQTWRTWALKYHPGEGSTLRTEGYIMQWRNLIYPYGEGVGGKVAESLSSLLIRNYAQYMEEITPSVPEMLATGGISSAISVPMCTNRGLIGVLCAASSKNNAFSRAQLKIMETLGNQAAIAIENAHYYAEQKLLADKLQYTFMTHERLLGLVLSNQGIQSIADTLSDLINCPVFIQGKDYQVVCYSLSGSEEGVFQKFESILSNSPPLKDLLADKNNRQAGTIVPPTITIQPQNSSQGIQRTVASIVAGKELYGYISAFEIDKPLDEQQRVALEEASIVLALEFLKQDAARAGLLQHIITAQEDERKRIARELHDETSQALTALMLGLDTIGLLLKDVPQNVCSRLNATKSIAEGMLDNIHRIISDLRPSVLDDLGLLAAVAWYCEQRLKPLNIKYELINEGLKRRLSSAIETALYRIVQEAITNIIRHAEATLVKINLKFHEHYLFLQISDNGKGFEPLLLKDAGTSQQRLGLWGMKERVNALRGELNIESAPGSGTTITVIVPFTGGVDNNAESNKSVIS